MVLLLLISKLHLLRKGGLVMPTGIYSKEENTIAISGEGV